MTTRGLERSTWFVVALAWALVGVGCGGDSSTTRDDCPTDASIRDATSDAPRPPPDATFDATLVDAALEDAALDAALDASTGSPACHELMRCAAACSTCEIDPCSGSAPLIDDGCVAGCAPEAWADAEARARYEPLASCYEASLGRLWDAPRACAEPLAACCTSVACLGTLPDAPMPDAGMPDAGTLDSGVRDAGVRDAGIPGRDAGVDAGPTCIAPDELTDLRIATCEAGGATRVTFNGSTTTYAYETTTGPTSIPPACGVRSRTLAGVAGANRIELPGGPSSLGECWTWRLCAVDSSCSASFSSGVLIRECVQAGPGGAPASVCSLPRP